MNKVSSIIQARTGSSRLPGKVLEKLGEETVLKWLIYRTKKAKKSNEVILATTVSEHDSPLCECAKENNINVYRGNTNNVLDRYYEAALSSNTDIIIRICADRPFIDPCLIDSAVNLYESSNVDIVFNHISDKNEWWPRGFGVEVFSTDLLVEFMKLELNSQHKEHVTLYAWENRNKYKIIPDFCPPEINPGVIDLKLDLDTQDDLITLRKISEYINMDSSTSEIIDVWKSHIRF